MKSLLLNLIDKSKSDIQYHIDRYPDGQIQLVLEDLDDNKFHLKVLARLCNSDDLFIMMQLSDIVNRRGLGCDLYITYLLAARTDRLFSWNTSFTLKVVMDVLDSFNPQSINILDSHSDSIYYLGKCKSINSLEFLSYLNSVFPNFFGGMEDDVILVAPDEGARERLEFILGNSPYIFEYVRPSRPRSILYCEKVRDKDGKIVKVEINSDSAIYVSKKSRLVVMDDLCDGGGTFLAIYPELKKLNPSKIEIVVTHSIQKSGIEKLAALYDNVVTSNSYRDWNESDLPDNVTIVDVVSLMHDNIVEINR